MSHTTEELISDLLECRLHRNKYSRLSHYKQAQEHKEEGGGRGDKLTGRKAVVEGWDTATSRYRVR
eukprot:COSAG06_NODE_14409_length_1159_cov_1.638679_1_plen_65_part_10